MNGHMFLVWCITYHLAINYLVGDYDLFLLRAMLNHLWKHYDYEWLHVSFVRRAQSVDFQILIIVHIWN